MRYIAVAWNIFQQQAQSIKSRVNYTLPQTNNDLACWILTTGGKILQTTISLFIIFVIIEHLAFMLLEMALWTKPIGMKIFGNTRDKAKSSQILAANQGLYNGFLAAGLIWGITYPEPVFSHQLLVFFLSCIVVAGVFGGITAKKTILYVQAIPAAIPLLLLILN